MVLNICMAHDATKHLKTLQLFRSEADARKHASKHRCLNPIIKPLCIVLVPRSVEEDFMDWVNDTLLSEIRRHM